MIRLALRQFRTAGGVAVFLLLAVAVAAVVTRPHLTLSTIDNTVPRTVSGLVVIVTPALVGTFWGAPLVAREFEAGTHQLVWTQSISRGRWLAGKLAVVGAATVVATGALSALVTWWAVRLDQAAAAAYGTFDQRDIAPIGYAVFALALGVVAGLLVRGTLPAMALTLAGLLAVRIAVTEWVRPLVAAPRVESVALDPDTTGYGAGGNILLGIGPSTLQPRTPDIPDAWIQSVRVVDAAGHPLSDQVLAATCPTLGQGGHGPARPAPEGVRQALHDCVARIGEQHHEVITYQPGDRYWIFQWWELSVFVLLAALLCGFAYYRIRR